MKITYLIHQHDDNVCPPVVPSKAYPSDVGYDLTLVRYVKRLNTNTEMYDSSISVIVPDGYYMEIVPRSSLSKYGYVMANSVGIIDPNYRGTLKVVLTKVEPEAEELVLPITRFQLILRKKYEADISACHAEDFEEPHTDRNTGGFGSTDH